MGYPLVSSGSSSNSMDVSPWESTGKPVLIAVTVGAAGSTDSSNILSPVNSPLTLTAPNVIFMVAFSEFP